MTTELRKRGDFTKILLNGYLKDITNNEEILINTPAIKTDNKISYFLNKEKYSLELITPKKLILKRTTDEIDSTIYFELNKVIPAKYTLKGNNLSIQIDIRTKKIEITDKYIKITYTVIDSDIIYEYYIEMSE